MLTVIYKKPNFHLFPYISPPNSSFSPAHNLQNFLKIQPKSTNYTFNTRILCSAAYTDSPSYGGWDDCDSVHSTESDQLHNFLNFLGIGDKKYVFVYVLGFACALAISRVKVSSIIVFPACAVVFAIGFSIGLAKGGHLKEITLHRNRRKNIDETSRGSIEKVKNLNDNLVEYKDKVVNLRDGVKRNIECDQVSLSDLEGYLDTIESVYAYFSTATEVVENVLGDNQDKERVLDDEPKKKKFGIDGLNFSQFPDGKREVVKSRKEEHKQENILAASTSNSDVNEKIEDENYEFAGNLSDGDTMKCKRDSSEKNDTTETFFDRREYGYQNKTSQSSNNPQVHLKDYHDRNEEMASHESSYDSIDFSVRMKQTKNASSFRHQQKRETIDSPPSFDIEFANENVFGSSRIGDDMEFEKYLGEANNLLKEAKGSFKKQADDSNVEKTLNKSAILLSRAIEMRPMSLLAVGQLGNTYLLHGELKLRVSRELRSLLHKFDDQFSDKGKIMSALGDVCEECEDLLIKAGRKYKLVLSIDENDMRALYNWGLALGFRAQLIADIGPSAARDADKVFLAAIDKFDAMLSKSNVYAPDALFRWGAALQQRSRLRPRNSREKVKLLQQARCLYEDALNMDSKNLQLQRALSSCLSELDYWYR